MIINPIINLWIMIPLAMIAIYYIFVNYLGLKRVLRITLIVLLFIVNLRIMIPNVKTTSYSSNLDIIFVVDSTISMKAEDVAPSRLEQIKKDINYIMDKTAGASYAVINFDNNSYIRMIMTKDADGIAAAVDSITVVDEFYAKGTKVTMFKNKLEELLKREEKHPDNKVAVYIFTDGENTSGKQEEDLKELKKYIDGGAILGYGTNNGVGIKVENYNGEIEYLYYYDERYRKIKAITKIDESNMKNISKDLGIEYIHMTSTNKVDSSINNIIKQKTNTKNDNEKYSYKDTYFFLTPLIGIILFIELYDYRRIRI